MLTIQKEVILNFGNYLNTKNSILLLDTLAIQEKEWSAGLYSWTHLHKSYIKKLPKLLSSYVEEAPQNSLQTNPLQYFSKFSSTGFS